MKAERPAAKAKEFIEGPEAFQRFGALMGKLVAMPREEMARREAEYQAQAALKPKRGPKPKPAASRAPGASPQA